MYMSKISNIAHYVWCSTLMGENCRGMTVDDKPYIIKYYELSDSDKVVKPNKLTSYTGSLVFLPPKNLLP